MRDFLDTQTHELGQEIQTTGKYYMSQVLLAKNDSQRNRPGFLQDYRLRLNTDQHQKV